MIRLARVLSVLITLLIFTQSLLCEDKPCDDFQVTVVKSPVYPPIGLAAHVQGTVDMHMKLSAEGKIIGLEFVSGPELLRGAANEYVLHWQIDWQDYKKHHDCVEEVIVDFKLLEPTKSVSSYSYEIVTEDGVSKTVVIVRPKYYKPNVMY